MLQFEKLQGTGNDFIIFNGIENTLPNHNELAQKVCSRNYGIGADGMMVVEKSNIADIKMLFYNADGTQAPMCGNGIRCFAKYIYENKIIKEERFTVETLGGIMKPEVIIEDKKIKSVKVNLGSPIFLSKDIPIDTNEENFIDKNIKVGEETINISGLVIGTIHTVIFVDDFNKINIEELGKAVENHKLFPLKTNVNFVRIIDKTNIEVITWERGVGITLACGTGAAASAAVSSMLYDTEKTVNVHVKGGKLIIEQIDGAIYMTGPAVKICEGVYYNEKS
ncbi:diaminopimelate epimerase [Oceanirhabdus sp. W0125-5]|uniref:diaminopimelate epimerase n=1 Tax=Oceanirhabdus sp. W0125-5 TaxID=2999116 RepID=UPI0022F2C9FA|nr:diaminopimelate epimerase [Oceanirhabdus sp. W0125-5]WBW97151.1 diaminopimelate epimerase [Oceanirhabdus sp. W0125-5]